MTRTFLLFLILTLGSVCHAGPDWSKIDPDWSKSDSLVGTYKLVEYRRFHGRDGIDGSIIEETWKGTDAVCRLIIPTAYGGRTTRPRDCEAILKKYEITTTLNTSTGICEKFYLPSWRLLVPSATQPKFSIVLPNCSAGNDEHSYSIFDKVYAIYFMTNHHYQVYSDRLSIRKNADDSLLLKYWKMDGNDILYAVELLLRKE